MALVLADRVRETTTTTGTGTVTLGGAATGFQSFAVVGNGNTTYYVIAGQGTSEWEVGIGTYTSAGTTLARTTVLASSNAGSAVNFSAGTKDVFVTYPAGKSVNQDASGNVGIGTSSPTTRLTVLSSTNQGIAVNDGTVNTILYNTGSANGTLGTTTNHPMAFYTNNAERMRIDSSGNVSITSAIAGAKSLYIYNSDAGAGSYAQSYVQSNNGLFNITVGSTANGGVSSLYSTSTGGAYLYTVGAYALRFGTNSTETMRIDSSGNVGIGTTSPATEGTNIRLSVVGTAGQQASSLATSNTNAGFSVRANSSSGYTLAIGATNNGSQPYIQAVNYNGGAASADLAIQAYGGNVGIGTSSPVRKLQVGSVSAGNGLAVTGSAPNISLSNADTEPNTNSITSVFALATSAGNYGLNAGEAAWLGIGNSRGNFIINPNYSGTGTKDVVIQPSSGNVGIGTTSPNLSSSSTALTVNTATAANYAALEIASAGTLNFYINANNAASYINSAGTRPMVFYTNSAERMRITSNGGVSFGATGTAYGTSGQVLTSAGDAPPTWTTATSANTASAIVQRDASGNFSAGAVTATVVSASNGIYVNSQTVAASYTIATGSSGMSAGPITIASGQSVTVSSGSRWVVL